MPTDASLLVFNTLTRGKEPFRSVEPARATIYTCGPTVYRYAHIGNLRSYLMADWLRRFLEAQGYSVTHVKNITDVGHMRQEMLERGEDKVLAAALAEGKSPGEIAAFYTAAFLADEAKLNILPASRFPRASENVNEMVSLTSALVDKGFAYEVDGNVYFEVSTFPEYGKLSGQQGEGLLEGVRTEADPLKRDQRDFALWKAAEPGRQVKWPSPWGEGFPGWHIECSAMAAKFLGPEIDIHTGGVDNIFPHHEDEIAQSEAATGRRHVRYWLHAQHLLMDGLKMAKSTGNTYQIADLERRGFDPLAFRYLCATSHYRARLNFTLPSLRAAQRGLSRLRASLVSSNGRPSKKAAAQGENLRSAFWSAAADDLNIPRALSVAWEVGRSRLPGDAKRELLMDFDRLLGLDLLRAEPIAEALPQIDAMRQERHVARVAGDYARADPLRDEVLAMGYEVRDGRRNTVVLPVPLWQLKEANISSSRDVDSLLEGPAELDFTVSIAARQGCAELERCISSVTAFMGDTRAEIIVVDNGLEDECALRLDGIARDDARVRLFRADHFLGSAAGRNVSLRQARGRYVLFIDTSVELKGDIRPRLRELLDDPTVGMAGRWGVVTNDLRSFDEVATSGDVDAVEGYLMAFRREVLQEAGFLDEKYRFYRHLDLDFSFAVRSRGYRAVIDTELPVVRHDHVDWLATPQEERDRLSKRNFYRFLHKWGERTDLAAARG
jgi:cysteinyl-tRNA synthetase